MGELTIDSNARNRLLIVYCGELDCYVQEISAAFSELLLLVEHSRPPAQSVHQLIRRILSEAALISLVFFPQREKSKTAFNRSDLLRKEFSIRENSLLKNRALRNHLAHLDERLDKWAMNSENRTFGRGMLASRSGAYETGLNDEDILGIFDPRTFVFAFLENDIAIDELVREIMEIGFLSRQILRKTPWNAGKKNVH